MKIIIPGKPIAKQRHRYCKRGRFVTTYDPQDSCKQEVRRIITAQLSEQANSLDKYTIIELGKICSAKVFSVCFTFFLPINLSDSVSVKNRKLWGLIKASTKPDYDNLEKFYLDCANGVLWDDDASVIKASAVKLYSEEPRVEIVVSAVQDVRFNQKVEQAISVFSPSEFKGLQDHAKQIAQITQPDLETLNDTNLEEWIISTAVLLSDFAMTYAPKLTKIAKLGDIKSEIDNYQALKLALEA